MIRLLTFLLLITLGGASAELYRLKYKVEALDREAAALQRQILAEREALRLLDADWAYLNQPERLQMLAARHLNLAPIDPRQFVTLVQVPMRMPGVDLPKLPSQEVAPAPEANLSLVASGVE